MTSIGYGRARLVEVPKDFWGSAQLPAVWHTAREIIQDVLKRLAEFGITSPDLLPSTNSLIPLFALHHYWAGKQGYRFGRALRWFLIANQDGRYSGSAITSLNEDVRTITEAASFDSALENLYKRLRVSAEISAERFLDRYDRAGARFLRLMLYLVLFSQGALDWVDGTRLGYDRTGSAVIAGFEPQWHHIYPRNVLRGAQIPDDEIHALANITVLNERTNANRLAGKEPWRYIRQFNISPDMLKPHLIPEPFIGALKDDKSLQKQWSVQRYADFLVERAQQLAKEANAFLRRLDL